MTHSVARLIKELPEDYEAQCTEQGAVRRWRGVKSPADLMMLILIHLMNGTSLLDRIYSTVKGMAHCLDAGTDFVLRMRKNSFKACGADGKPLDLIEEFQNAGEDCYIDFRVVAVNKDGTRIPVRGFRRRGVYGVRQSC